MYTLIGPDGQPYQSETKGTLSGYRKSGAEKLYGRLDCKSAVGFIARGHYVKYRVFFANEATAIAAGHRPCGKCMRKEFEAWKLSRHARGTSSAL